MAFLASTSNTKTGTTSPMAWVALSVLGLSIAISGCTRGSNLNQGGLFSSRSQPDPLPPTPTNRVRSGQLEPAQPTPPPAPAQPTAPQTVQPAPQQPEQVANVEPAPAPTSGRDFQASGTNGVYGLTTGSTNCRIILALTSWSGGYRASTTGCGGSDLAEVSAWDVRNNKLLIKDNNGAVVATLVKTGDRAFTGTSKTGAKVIIF